MPTGCCCCRVMEHDDDRGTSLQCWHLVTAVCTDCIWNTGIIIIIIIIIKPLYTGIIHTEDITSALTTIRPRVPSMLRYIRVIYSALSTRLLNHYDTRCMELETKNRKKIIWKKRGVLRRFRKIVSVGAEVTSGSRLFQRCQHNFGVVDNVL